MRDRGWRKEERRERGRETSVNANQGDDFRTRVTACDREDFSRDASFPVARRMTWIFAIYRVLTPADGPRARRLSIWLPLHSDV